MPIPKPTETSPHVGKMNDLWLKALVAGEHAQPLYIGTDKQSGRLMVTSDETVVDSAQIQRLQTDLTGQRFVRDFSNTDIQYILPVSMELGGVEVVREKLIADPASIRINLHTQLPVRVGEARLKNIPQETNESGEVRFDMSLEQILNFFRKNDHYSIIELPKDEGQSRIGLFMQTTTNPEVALAIFFHEIGTQVERTTDKTLGSWHVAGQALRKLVDGINTESGYKYENILQSVRKSKAYKKLIPEGKAPPSGNNLRASMMGLQAMANLFFAEQKVAQAGWIGRLVGVLKTAQAHKVEIEDVNHLILGEGQVYQAIGTPKRGLLKSGNEEIVGYQRKPELQMMDYAQEILGEDFLGYEAVKGVEVRLNTRGIQVEFDVSQLPSFPYSERDIELAKENGEILVLRPERIYRGGRI